MHISLAAETLFNIGGFRVTNSLLVSLVVDFVLITLALIVSRTMDKSPKGIQNLFEVVIEAFLDLTEQVGGKKARKFFPLVLTFFFFILFSNWIGLLPGFGSIGIDKIENGQKVFVPIFRGATADLNTTLALALISFFAIQYYGIKAQKLGYFKKFFNFKSPMEFFAGILELVSEFTKIISFSFRLFGNVLAGEIILAVVAFLIPVLASFPFFSLEIFVGFIQALVFAILTLVFIHMATESHEEEVGYGSR